MNGHFMSTYPIPFAFSDFNASAISSEAGAICKLWRTH